MAETDTKAALPEEEIRLANNLFDEAHKDGAWTDWNAVARRVLADRKAAVEAAVDESFARGVERTKIAEAADRAERIAKVEEAAYDAHEYLPDDMYSAHRAISAIVAAAKGEKP